MHARLDTFCFLLLSCLLFPQAQEMPLAALPKNPLDAKRVQTIIDGVEKVASVFACFTEEAKDDCIAMARLHLAGPAPFSWHLVWSIALSMDGQYK